MNIFKVSKAGWKKSYECWSNRAGGEYGRISERCSYCDESDRNCEECSLNAVKLCHKNGQDGEKGHNTAYWFWRREIAYPGDIVKNAASDIVKNLASLIRDQILKDGINWEYCNENGVELFETNKEIKQLTKEAWQMSYNTWKIRLDGEFHRELVGTCGYCAEAECGECSLNKAELCHTSSFYTDRVYWQWSNGGDAFYGLDRARAAKKIFDHIEADGHKWGYLNKRPGISKENWQEVYNEWKYRATTGDCHGMFEMIKLFCCQLRGRYAEHSDKYEAWEKAYNSSSSEMKVASKGILEIIEKDGIELGYLAKKLVTIKDIKVGDEYLLRNVWQGWEKDDHTKKIIEDVLALVTHIDLTFVFYQYETSEGVVKDDYCLHGHFVNKCY